MSRRRESEFAIEPVPGRGLSTVEAHQLLLLACPGVTEWICWEPAPGSAVPRIGSATSMTGGEFAGWRWSAVECDYPAIRHHQSMPGDGAGRWNWTGLIRIEPPDGPGFLLFSFLDSSGEVGAYYYVSTRNPAILADLEQAAKRGLSGVPSNRIPVTVINGRQFLIDLSAEEDVVLAKGMKQDIDAQVTAFFTRKHDFHRLRLPYRRGLLFAGPPGCGKTMMVRRLVRHCAERFNASFWSIALQNSTDGSDLEMLFDVAAASSPGIIILEEIDSLVKHTRVPRATLLSCLDGLESGNGTLVLATTNHPADVDPALIHRPSRFDRVWTFQPPALALRTTFLAGLFPGQDPALTRDLAVRTEGWSFAYLKELRVTAIFLTMEDLHDPSAASIWRAYELLDEQFTSGRTHYASQELAGVAGFGGAA